jgi:hypothetical protein
MSFARGSNGDVYGVNGENRGFRWDTITANVEQLGISAPTAAMNLAVTTAATGANRDIYAIDVVDGGCGYRDEPVVTVGAAPGGGTTAVAKATVVNGRIHRVTVQKYGHGYTSPPACSVPAPDNTAAGGSGATLTVQVSGHVSEVAPTDLGSGYTSPPSVLIAAPPSGTTAGGICGYGLDNIGPIACIYQGSGYQSAPSVTVSGDGTGATAKALMRYRVTGVTVTNGGSGYGLGTRIIFQGGEGGGAVAEPVLNENGAIASVRVLNGGHYRIPPTAVVVPNPTLEPRRAVLSPICRQGIKGKYWCAIRFIDDTAAEKDGPIPSSISELKEVEVPASAGAFNWSWVNTGIEARVDKIELWRTTADQAIVLYKVAEVSKSTTSYSDTLSDAQLADPARTGFQALPLTLPNGQVNARRFTPPPQNKRAVTIFQDRAWYAVDVPGKKYDGTADANAAEPNALYFSELDEPESVPQTNELIIQENVKGQDRITALMPFGGGMVVFQERHCYRLTYVSQPIIDANISLIAQRGCLNQRCWDTFDGVAYVVDSSGMYMLDGANAVPLSDSVEQYWTNQIHFPSSKWFFVRVDPATRIVRFFFAVQAGFPDRAVCFHPLTKAWWLETYAQTFASAECLASGGRQTLIAGGGGGALLRFDSGSQDRTSSGGSANIACTFRTGNFPLAVGQKDRNVRVLYRPTSATCNLTLGLHYNNSATARPAAVATDRGTGFTTDAAQNAVLNLAATRSALGTATGYATANYAGRVDDRSAGADRHIAIGVSLTRPSGDAPVIYGLGLSGAGG